MSIENQIEYFKRCGSPEGWTFTVPMTDEEFKNANIYRRKDQAAYYKEKKQREERQAKLRFKERLSILFFILVLIALGSALVVSGTIQTL